MRNNLVYDEDLIVRFIFLFVKMVKKLLNKINGRKIQTLLYIPLFMCACLLWLFWFIFIFAWITFRPFFWNIDLSTRAYHFLSVPRWTNGWPVWPCVDVSEHNTSCRKCLTEPNPVHMCLRAMHYLSYLLASKFLGISVCTFTSASVGAGNVNSCDGLSASGMCENTDALSFFGEIFAANVGNSSAELRTRGKLRNTAELSFFGDFDSILTSYRLAITWEMRNCCV